MSVGLKALAKAQSRVGVSESPPGSNSGPLVSAWLKIAKASVPNPWCAAFMYSMFIEARSQAVKLILAPASVLSWVQAAVLMRQPSTAPRRVRNLSRKAPSWLVWNHSNVTPRVAASARTIASSSAKVVRP